MYKITLLHRTAYRCDLGSGHFSSWQHRPRLFPARRSPSREWSHRGKTGSRTCGVQCLPASIVGYLGTASCLPELVHEGLKRIQVAAGLSRLSWSHLTTLLLMAVCSSLARAWLTIFCARVTDGVTGVRMDLKSLQLTCRVVSPGFGK